MKLLLASVLTMLLFSTMSKSSLAEEKNTELQESKPYLAWEITSKNIDATIIGSIHYTVATSYPLPEHIEARFLASSSLILETFEGDEVANTVLRELSAFDSGDRICRRLSASNCNIFHARLNQFQLEPSIVDRYKPWFAAMTLSGLDVQKLASGPGVDEYFQHRTEKLKRPIYQLESLRTLFSTLDSKSDTEQIAELEESLVPTDQKELRNIESYWQQGDISELLKIESTENGRISPILVAADQREMRDRNKAMAAKLSELLKDDFGKRAFIVVGYSHLIGEGNVLDKLREDGFVISRLLKTN